MEGVGRLEAFIAAESDRELRDFAALALGEARYAYYGPKTPEEERQYLLAQIIHEREERLMKAVAKADEVKCSLRRVDVERDVHTALMKHATAAQKEAWEYSFMEDFYASERNRLSSLEDDIAYQSAWIREAGKMITLKKYQHIPPSIFEHLHLDGDKGAFWTDDMPPPAGEDEIPVEDIPF